MKKIMVKLVSIFVVLSMLCTTLCITSFASSVSYDGEIFVDAGSAVCSQYARRDYQGTYTMTDGRIVPVYRFVRLQDSDYDANDPSTYDGCGYHETDIGYPASDNNGFCVYVKVWTDKPGTYNLETLATAYNSTSGYCAYKMYKTDPSKSANRFDPVSVADTYSIIQHPEIEGTVTDKFYIHDCGTVELEAGENIIGLRPANRMGKGYQLGLGYLKFTPVGLTNNDVSFRYDGKTLDGVTSVATRKTHGDFSISTNANKAYGSDGIDIGDRTWKLSSTKTYDTTVPYYVNYTFNAPIDGYYNVFVESNGVAAGYSTYDIYMDQTCLKSITEETEEGDLIYYKDADKTELTDRIVKWSCGKIYLSSGEHVFSFKNIAKKPNGTTVAEGSGKTDDSNVHNFRFYKVDFDYAGALDLANGNTLRNCYRILNNTFHAYSDVDKGTYSDNDIFVTGTVYVENKVNTDMSFNVYLAEYENDILKKIKGVNIPVAADTADVKTRMINYDITADDFDMTVNSDGTVTFDNKVILFVWDGISPVLETLTIAE